MNILKNNFISLFILLVCLSGLSYASTITRPYTSADYAGGAKAVGSKVNAEFQNIVNWLNSGNIASGNIAAFGVEAINIAPDAVTTAKIASGNVTKAKLSGANIVISTASTVFVHAGTTQANVPNLTATITTSGRPVQLSLVSNLSNGLVYSEDSAPDGGSNLLFIRDSSTVSKNKVSMTNASSPRYNICSEYTFIEIPSAGSHTYTVAVNSTSTGTAIVSGCSLVVQEF